MAEPTPDLAAIVARGDRIVTIPEGAAFHGGFSEDVTVAVRAALKQRAKLERALREQWRAAHFDHCCRVNSKGVCKELAAGRACVWPLPALLDRAAAAKEPSDG